MKDRERAWNDQGALEGGAVVLPKGGSAAFLFAMNPALSGQD
jgi:hypothetical protein